MKRTILVLFLLLTCLCPASLLSQGEKQPARAVSLKTLQEQLRERSRRSEWSEELLRLGGLTRIDGYVLDEANGDVILFGLADKDRPPLYTEDFIVALRNAWMKYAELKQNTYYYSNPGCSIDPDPSVMRELKDLVDKTFSQSTSEEMDELIQQWHGICKQPQKVRVLGIPFNTRFAETMVEADYYMKKLVSGSESLGIEGFASLVDMTLSQAKEGLWSDKSASISLSSMNRFWFCPGESKYKYDMGIVLIDRCRVLLLSEEQYLTKSNHISGKGRPDPLAERFARSFSERYSQIAWKKPIYLKLEALFRLVAVAKIMKHNRVKENLGLGYLLDDALVARIGVATTLQGISHVREFRHDTSHVDGFQTVQLWLPSCGGVAIEMNIHPEAFEKAGTDQLARLKDSIIESRPSKEAFSWELIQ